MSVCVSLQYLFYVFKQRLGPIEIGCTPVP
jgi:hypothetical protein